VGVALVGIAHVPVHSRDRPRSRPRHCRSVADGDGYDDLAIGVPGEDIGTINWAGGVNVLYGFANGLTASRDQFSGIPQLELTRVFMSPGL